MHEPVSILYCSETYDGFVPPLYGHRRLHPIHNILSEDPGCVPLSQKHPFLSFTASSFPSLTCAPAIQGETR